MEEILLFLSGTLFALGIGFYTYGGYAIIPGSILVLFAVFSAMPYMAHGRPGTIHVAVAAWLIGAVAMAALWWMTLAPDAPARRDENDRSSRRRAARRSRCAHGKRWCR